MQFIQKYPKGPFPRYKTRFEFGDEELTYSFDNSVQKQGASLRYDHISPRGVYRKGLRWKIKYMFAFFLTYALLEAVYFRDTRFLLVSAILPVTLFIFLAVGEYFGRQTAGISTLFTSNNAPPVIVLEDGQHQAILDEIDRRRLNYLRLKRARVDFNKPYYEEVQKFKWLFDEDIISEQEYIHARQKIAAMRDKKIPDIVNARNLN